VLTVSELWRYPVKSLGGETVRASRVDEFGIADDRAWGVFDPSTGMVLTARREPALLFLTAHATDGRPEVTCDDGSTLGDDRALSSWMGREVELRHVSSGPATFENPLDVDTETNWMQWDSPNGTFHDGRSKISLVSTTSLGEWDRRRFRINVILDGSGEEDLPEHVNIGSVGLRIRKPIERCIMVSRGQPGIPKDLSVLKRVIAERNNQLGIGAVITTPGTIAVGDRLT
jgi:uncharacterized protein YcbX